MPDLKFSELDFLVLDDLELEGKKILVRVDINTPIHPKTRKLMERSRLEEVVVTIRALNKSSVVLCSHQGRVGNNDYVSLEQHAEALSEILGKKVEFIDDVIGPAAREAIKELQPGEILLLDNLRLLAEETHQYPSIDSAARTFIVQRLWRLFDAFVLDAFPTAHRAHPSIIGFPYYLPTAAGVLVMKELKQLRRLELVRKGPYTAVLGGSKVRDRLEAISALIENGRADKVLLTGVIALVFLKAMGKIRWPIGIKDEEWAVKYASELLEKYPSIFEVPRDVAIEKDGDRVELEIDKLEPGMRILDIGENTISFYSKIIRSSGTVFMSGPPGAFEIEGFEKGTVELLHALASSFGTTVVSGGHLVTALNMFRISRWIDHISTSGGALIQALAGKELPLLVALSYSARKYRRGEYDSIMREKQSS